MTYEGEDKREHDTPSWLSPGRRELDKENMDLFPPLSEQSIVTLVQLIHHDVKTVRANMGELSSKLDGHLKEENIQLAEAIANVLDKSFPQGDALGHKKHHELSIKAAEDRAAFWSKMRFELSRWGLIGFIGWVVYSLWKAFLLGPIK